MACLNKATLIGNLGSDPTLQTTKENLSIAKFSIATMDIWKDKNGNNQERTEWHRIVTFGRLAEVCGEYLSKGKLVYIERSHTSGTPHFGARCPSKSRL